MNLALKLKIYFGGWLKGLNLAALLHSAWWLVALLAVAALALDASLFYRYVWQQNMGEWKSDSLIDRKAIERAGAILEKRKQEFKTAAPLTDLPNRFQ